MTGSELEQRFETLEADIKALQIDGGHFTAAGGERVTLRMLAREFEYMLMRFGALEAQLKELKGEQRD